MVLGAQPKTEREAVGKTIPLPPGQGRNGKIMRTWFFPKGEEPIDLVVRSPQPDLQLGKNGMGEKGQDRCTFFD